MQDISLERDLTIKAERLDIVAVDSEEINLLVFDLAIPGDVPVHEREQKMLKNIRTLGGKSNNFGS